MLDVAQYAVLPKETGERIKYLMNLRGLTTKDIQKVMGFTGTQAVYKWQEGKSLPTVDNLVILSALFGVSMNDILVTRGQGCFFVYQSLV
jgi:transcriptional regulator with XRE-family HTH domain